MKLLNVALHHLVLCEFLSFLVHSTPPVGLFFSPPDVSGTFLTLGLWNNLVSSASNFSLSCPLGLLELIIYFSAYSLFFLKAFLFHVRNNVVYHTLNFPVITVITLILLPGHVTVFPMIHYKFYTLPVCSVNSCRMTELKNGWNFNHSLHWVF